MYAAQLYAIGRAPATDDDCDVGRAIVAATLRARRVRSTLVVRAHSIAAPVCDDDAVAAGAEATEDSRWNCDDLDDAVASPTRKMRARAARMRRIHVIVRVGAAGMFALDAGAVVVRDGDSVAIERGDRARGITPCEFAVDVTGPATALTPAAVYSQYGAPLLLAALKGGGATTLLFMNNVAVGDSGGNHGAATHSITEAAANTFEYLRRAGALDAADVRVVAFSIPLDWQAVAVSGAAPSSPTRGTAGSGGSVVWNDVLPPGIGMAGGMDGAESVRCATISSERAATSIISEAAKAAGSGTLVIRLVSLMGDERAAITVVSMADAHVGAVADWIDAILIGEDASALAAVACPIARAMRWAVEPSMCIAVVGVSSQVPHFPPFLPTCLLHTPSLE